MAAVTPQKLSIRKPPAGMPAPKFSDDLRVAWVPGAKPAGTISGDRYTLYCVAKTVGEAKKLGAKQADVRWDWDKGYMHLTDQHGVPLIGYSTAPSTEVAAAPAPRPQKKVERPPANVTTPQKRTAPKPAAATVTPAAAKPKPEVVVEPPPAKRIRTLALPRLLARAEKLRAQGKLPPLQSEEVVAEQKEQQSQASESVEEQQAPMEVEEKAEEHEAREEEQQPEVPMQVDEQIGEQEEVRQADEAPVAPQVDEEQQEQVEETPQEAQQEQSPAAEQTEPAPATEEQQQEAEPVTEA